ncbi:MAG: hypothetical protein IT160_06165, partial [Bryobacterales bacterium]|nr:hypothetical protein [Bryobacterales bacterium]
KAVPGVLFSTRRTTIPDPELKDLTVTLLRLYGLDPPKAMTGRNLY